MTCELVRGRRRIVVISGAAGSLRAVCEQLEPRAYLSAVSFGSPIALPVNGQVIGNSIPSAVSGDFNSDGKEDVAVLDAKDNGIDILLNQGNGQFTLSTVLPDGGGQIGSLAAANLGNGQIDLVLSNVTTGSVYVYLGNGDGTFSGPEVYRFATPDSISVAATDFLTVADLNGDGSPDLLVADDLDNQLVTFLNQGGGVFALSQSLSTINPGGVVVGNFFGANNSLYAVTNSGQAFSIGSTGTLVGIGAIDFGFSVAGDFAGSGELVTGDFNNDGVADIAKLFVNQSSGVSYVDVLLGNTGSFEPAIITPVTSNASALAVGDFNADGNEDLLVGGPSSTELFEGNGTGSFTDSGVSLAAGGWNTAAVDSFTTSGNLDVVLPGVSDGKPGAFLFENGSSSAAATVMLVSSQNPAGPGQLVKFTATVKSGTTAATGKVEFFDSSKEIGSAGLVNGVAHFSTKKLINGGHDITARYLGSGTLVASSSAVLLETVGPGLGVGNLLPSFPKTKVPAALVAGSKFTQTIDLVNDGTGPSTGTSHVTFYASPTATFDSATAVFAGSATRAFRLKVNGKASFSTKITYPADLTPGNYYLLAVIADGNGHTNTVASSTTTTVAAPFVQLSDKILNVSSTVKPGKNASVSLEVFNTGNVVATGPLTIDLETSISSDGSDADAWTTLVKKISIKAKGHAVLSLSSPLPADLAAGDYFAVATIDPANKFHQPSLADNVAVSAKEIALA